MKEHTGSFSYACKCIHTIYIHQEDTGDINIRIYLYTNNACYAP